MTMTMTATATATATAMTATSATSKSTNTKTIKASSVPSMIPLSSMCVAAAFADDPSGTIIEYNDLFRRLVVIPPPPPPPSVEGGGESEEVKEQEQAQSIPDDNKNLETSERENENVNNNNNGNPNDIDNGDRNDSNNNNIEEKEGNDPNEEIKKSAPASSSTTTDASTSEPGSSTKLEENSIWKLLSMLPPATAVNIPITQTKQIYQGPDVPNKWVRIHLCKMERQSSLPSTSTSASSFCWLVQLEDVDVGERAQNQWTAILETSFDGFWDYHILKDYEYMSPRFWEMFGYTPSEKLHKPSEWMDMVHPEDFKASMVDLQAHFASHGKVPYIRETRYKHKNGTWVWVLCRGKVIEWDDVTGAPLRMIGTHTDITESKLKELQERELYRKIDQEQKRIIAAKEELRKFVQHANAPVFGVDKNGVIDTWNDRMEQLTKIPKSTVVGKRLEESTILQKASVMVQQAINEGKERTNELLEIPIAITAKDKKSNTKSNSENDSKENENGNDDNKNNDDKNGIANSTLKLLVNISIRRHLTDGSILGCFCFGLDLTEIQVAQEKLLRAQERFKAEKQLNEFVAHEVRNPLAAAISATAFLKDSIQEQVCQIYLPKDMQESMREDVIVVGDSLDYIHQLLTSMLDLNKFLEKGVVLTPRPALLKRDIVDPVFQLYKHRTEKINFTTEVWGRRKDDGLLHVLDPNNKDENDDQRIQVDVVRLKQVLINLISNSIKFTKEGFVRVRIGRFDAKAPDKLSILVEDSGPGIPQEKRKLLFEKYVQLSTQFQGSGIGLALTRQLVQAMNGTIEIDQHYSSGIPGIPGTRFVVHVMIPQLEEETIKVELEEKKVEEIPPPPAPKPELKMEPEIVPSRQTQEDGNTSVKTCNGGTKMQNETAHIESRTPLFNAPPVERGLFRLESNNPKKFFNGRIGSNGSSMNGGMVTLEETIDSLHNSRAEFNFAQKTNGSSVSSAGNVDSSGFRTENLRVLIVDDDMVIRKLLTRRLKNLDKSMIVETAESGEIAIEKITGPNAKPYDLVLMDHFMPLCGGQLTGEETIKIIRPYIDGIIAGSSGNDMSKEHAAAGADLFWLKPVPRDNKMLDDLREAFKFTRCHQNTVSHVRAS